MTSDNKSLGATMTDLMNIVSPKWTVPSDNLNEVFPGIFLGDEFAAKNVDLLKQMKMTHILNAAYSEKTSFLYVNTSQNFYRDRKFECNFLGLSAVDCPTYKLSKYFQQASDFIDLALNFPQGKILVHCRQGVSRSATFVIIYLMIKKKMTGREAVTLVRKKRNIFPNKGFLKEICDLESQLLKAKHYETNDELLENSDNANCNGKTVAATT
ncbi:dual specificity protein phosphatase 3-like [Bradysia coprophila]|uniref:dual specificity protein phosphatase 3-like n=1 Tax=Bradysia coprophila TaxID=38358 RepID=UPI00187D78A6|nr:dual specificity protein phosphatase 3-like [Bradysia coprophila]